MIMANASKLRLALTIMARELEARTEHHADDMALARILDDIAELAAVASTYATNAGYGTPEKRSQSADRARRKIRKALGYTYP